MLLAKLTMMFAATRIVPTVIVLRSCGGWSTSRTLLVMGSAGVAALLAGLTCALGAVLCHLQKRLYAFSTLLLAVVMLAGAGSSLLCQGVLQGCRQPDSGTFALLLAPQHCQAGGSAGCWVSFLSI